MVWIKYKDRIHNKLIDVEVSEEVARYLWANDIYWRRLMKKVNKFECSYFASLFDDGDEIEFIETIKDERVDVEKEVENKIFAETIWKVAEKLQPLQKEILIERFKKDMKLCDIAKKHNISKSALTQLMATAYKHFGFLLVHDKEFMKTYWFETHYKKIAKEIFDTTKYKLLYGFLNLDLDNILSFKKEMTQTMKIASRLGYGISPQQKKLWQKISKIINNFTEKVKAL